MKIQFPLIGFAIFVVFVFGSSAQNSPCSCVHSRLLISRLNQVDISIQEYKARWETPGRSEVSGEPAYKGMDAARLFQSVGDLQNAVRLVDDVADESFLDPYDCDVKRGSTKDCIKYVQQPYFDFLRKECLPRKNPKTPYYEAMTLKEIAFLQMKAYEASRTAILQALRSLPPSCRDNDWFGYVVYQKDKSMSAVKNFLPTTGISKPSAGVSISSGGNEITGSRQNYLGTIYLSEGKSEGSRGYAAYTMENSKTISGRIYCSPKRPDEIVVQTSGRSEQLQGELFGKGTFSFSINPKGNYAISLGFYAVPVTGQIKTTGTTAGCDSKPISFSNSITTRLDAPAPYSFSGKIDPASPNLIQGNVIERPTPGNSRSTSGNTTVTYSEEINVRWTLRRIPNR